MVCVVRGRFLDAGTGTHSLKWINTLDTEGFTAVTADTQFADTTRKEVTLRLPVLFTSDHARVVSNLHAAPKKGTRFELADAGFS